VELGWLLGCWVWSLEYFSLPKMCIEGKLKMYSNLTVNALCTDFAREICYDISGLYIHSRLSRGGVIQ